MMIALMLLAATQEVDRLIEDLGGDNVTARGEAWKALADAGPAAIPALRKARYHEDPEIRVQAKEILKVVERRLALKPVVDPLLASIAKVRARWKARDFDDLETVVREAFQPASVAHFHYAPKKEIGARLETDSGGPANGGFMPPGHGGARDLLTREVADALGAGDGLLFLDTRLQRADVSDVLLFSLPDRAGGWTSYVVLKIAGLPSPPRKGLTYAADRFNSRLLASADSRQVWGIAAAEVEWAQANLEEILAAHGTFEAAAGGGLRLSGAAAGGILASRSFMTGDVIRDVNGVAVNSVNDLRDVLRGLEGTGLRVTVERQGRPIVLEYRPLPR